VQLVKVDVVSAQALQARVDGIEDVLAAGAALPAPWAHLARALGREDELVALPLQPLADDLLREARGLCPAAQRVDVRRVEECDAAGRGAVEDAERGRLVALQSERHGAEAEPADLQPRPAESRVFHRSVAF